MGCNIITTRTVPLVGVPLVGPLVGGVNIWNTATGKRNRQVITEYINEQLNLCKKKERLCCMKKNKEFLTLIDIKKIGRGDLKYAFKTLVFETETGSIVRWGTKTKLNYEIGFKAHCSFTILKTVVENNKIVMIVEQLRVKKRK